MAQRGDVRDMALRENLRERLYNSNFEASTVVNSLISRSEGLAQLERARQQLNDCKENAILELRKNAFQYHNVIIKAAKDMQQLEKSLSELKSTLNEERTALTNAVDLPDEAPIKKGAGDRRSAVSENNVDLATLNKRREETEVQEESPFPVWFKEAAVDIEDHYEMRRFGPALSLLTECKKYFASLSDSEKIAKAEPYYKQILDAEEGLTERLLKALKASMDCPFGVNKNICQQLINHIRSLNKSYDASVAFLDNRSRTIQLTIANVKADGNVSVYFKHRSDLFFKLLSQTMRAFDEYGFTGTDCKSALNGWIRFHITTFISQHIDSIFSDKSPNSVADCTRYLREGSYLLTDCGLDVTALLDGCIEDDATRFLNVQVERFVELHSSLAQDSKIQPIMFESKDALAAYLDKFASSGLGLAVAYVDGLSLNLSPQYIDFATQFLQTVCNILEISPSALSQQVVPVIKRLFEPAVNSLQSHAAKINDASINTATLYGTIEFFTRNVISAVDDAYKETFAKSAQPLATEREALLKLLASLKKKVKPVTYL